MKSIIQGADMDKEVKSFIKNVDLKLDGRTVSWLAERTGISQSKLSRLMNHQTEPSLADGIRISKILECGLEKLIDEGATKPETLSLELAPATLKAIRDAVKTSIEELKSSPSQIETTTDKSDLITAIITALPALDESELRTTLSHINHGLSRRSRSNKASV